jgi:hypothetical protein
MPTVVALALLGSSIINMLIIAANSHSFRLLMVLLDSLRVAVVHGKARTRSARKYASSQQRASVEAR